MTRLAVIFFVGLALLLAGHARAGYYTPGFTSPPAPRLTAVAGVNVYNVPWRHWPNPHWIAFYEDWDPDDAGPQGIYLSPDIYRPLVRALSGKRAKSTPDRLDLAFAISILGHELYHAQEANPDSENEEAAYAYGASRPVFLSLAARLGISSYDRRALLHLLSHPPK